MLIQRNRTPDSSVWVGLQPVAGARMIQSIPGGGVYRALTRKDGMFVTCADVVNWVGRWLQGTRATTLHSREIEPIGNIFRFDLPRTSLCPTRTAIQMP